MPVKERGAGRLYKQGRLGPDSGSTDDDGFWEENIALIREALEPDFRELKEGQATILEILSTQGEEISAIKSSVGAIERDISTIQHDIAMIQRDIATIKASAEKKD